MAHRKEVLTLIARRSLLGLLAAVAWVPVLGLLASSGPLAARVVVAGLAAVALSRPPVALLFLAGLAPLGGIVTLHFDMPYTLTEPFVMAFLAGWLSREACRPGTSPAAATRRILVPVVLLATVVGASVIVGLGAIQPFVAYPLQFVGHVFAFLWSDYFFDRALFSPLSAGLLLIEGLGIFAGVVVLTERMANLAPALVRITVASASGVAALSLNRLATVVLRREEMWDALRYHWSTIRISPAFEDVNAAGSYFAMATMAAISLGFAASRARWLWPGLAGLLMIGMWLTGSRVALFAVPLTVAALLMMVFRAGYGLRGRRVAIVVLVALALVGAGAALPFAVRDPVRLTMRQSVQDRWDLARAALAITARKPVFGVGVGDYRTVSGEFFTPGLKRLFPSENAHNNFLQILAELGLAGFVPFLWIMGGVGKRVWPGLTRRPPDWVLLGAAGGVAAFLITWVSGHPLLIAEVAYAFWILVGACVGLAPTEPDTASAPGPSPYRRWLSFVPIALVVFIVGTIPLRTRAAVANADLARAGIGFSQWWPDETGRPSRWIVASRAQFFVPGSASGMRLPLRLVAMDRTSTAEIAIYLDGRLANRLRLAAGPWNEVSMVFPERARGPFRRLTIDVGDRLATALATRGDPVRNVEGIRIGRPLLISKTAR